MVGLLLNNIESNDVGATLVLSNEASTETVSDVFKAKPVSLQGVVLGGEGLDGAGGAGGLEGWGRHAAQGEAQCPGNCHQQHMER